MGTGETKKLKWISYTERIHTWFPAIHLLKNACQSSTSKVDVNRHYLTDTNIYFSLDCKVTRFWFILCAIKQITNERMLLRFDQLGIEQHWHSQIVHSNAKTDFLERWLPNHLYSWGVNELMLFASSLRQQPRRFELTSLICRVQNNYMVSGLQAHLRMVKRNREFKIVKIVHYLNKILNHRRWPGMT